MLERADPPPIPEPSTFEGWSGEPVDAAPSNAEAIDPTVLTPPIINEPVSTPGEPAPSGATDSQETGSAPDEVAAGAPAAAGGFLSGLVSRFRPASSNGATQPPEPDAAPSGTSSSFLARGSRAIRDYFNPRLSLYLTPIHRAVLAIAAGVILLSLLVGSGGLALIVLSMVAPLLVVITLTQIDVFEKESNLIISGVIAAGALAGMLLAGIASWIQGEQWFDTGKLNFGAGGFSGPFGDAAGNPPAVVWLFSGVVLGAVGTAAIGGVAVALRRFPQFRNEAMDSIMIAGAAAAGYAIGASIIYWWPMVGDPGPVTNVQDWTLRVIGIAILRPATFTLCGALLGFGVWLYATNRSASVAGVPAMLGGLGLFLLHIIPATLQASGPWIEAIVTGILFCVAFPAYRFALDNAIEIDRLALGDEQHRIVCPACHRITPMGAFCAHCGQALTPAAEPPRDDLAAP